MLKNKITITVLASALVLVVAAATFLGLYYNTPYDSNISTPDEIVATADSATPDTIKVAVGPTMCKETEPETDAPTEPPTEEPTEAPEVPTEVIIEVEPTEEIVIEQTESNITTETVNDNYGNSSWNGEVLNPSNGVVYGPSGKETYYNLDMSGIVSIMRSMGNTDEYWIREDGCKMLGDYIMCAANLNVRPRGSLVESSLGMCIVCDTGGFAYSDPYQLDIAVNW